MEPKFYLMSDSPCDFTQQQVLDSNIGMFHFTYAEAGKENEGMHGVDDLFESVSARARRGRTTDGLPCVYRGAFGLLRGGRYGARAR